jgi:hypothetical protein
MTGAQTTEQRDEGGFEAEGRVLCADGACIGVVGEDGRCKVCGQPAGAAGGALAPGGVADEVGGAAVIDEVERPEEDEDFAERRLCPDDACIGVLGPDGRCKVCGREA